MLSLQSSIAVPEDASKQVDGGPADDECGDRDHAGGLLQSAHGQCNLDCVHVHLVGQVHVLALVGAAGVTECGHRAIRAAASDALVVVTREQEPRVPEMHAARSV